MKKKLTSVKAGSKVASQKTGTTAPDLPRITPLGEPQHTGNTISQLAATTEFNLGTTISQIAASFDSMWREEIEEMWQWFDEKQRENSHHENALKVLQKALESVGDDPAMTPEVKKIVEVFIHLVKYRRPHFNYEIETILRPVIEQTEEATIKESVRKAGSAPKKSDGMKGALQMYKNWVEKPATHKNQTAFTSAVVKAKFCDTVVTATNWLNQFRTEHPGVELEKKLPHKNN